MLDFYHISCGGTSMRVREDFWHECEENRELIRRKCVFRNGDTDYPRDMPLSIMVMSKDSPSGCRAYIDAEDFAETTRLEAKIVQHEANIAALKVEIDREAA